jgi:hypothetical protein
MIQKDSFMRNWSRYFYRIPNFNMRVPLGDISAKMRRENIFKPMIGISSLHQDSMVVK